MKELRILLMVLLSVGLFTNCVTVRKAPEVWYEAPDHIAKPVGRLQNPRPLPPRVARRLNAANKIAMFFTPTICGFTLVYTSYTFFHNTKKK